MDFLFPDGKTWDHSPVVGLDVMRHPRDLSILLVLLCFGVGCVILKFHTGEALPSPIHRFLSDKRIRFVGFGIPEKNDVFPFEELGLLKHEVDIGYIATKILKDPKYKRWELAELARKVLGIKRMVGLTVASSFERHEQIKCAICQLFITSVIAMGLIGANGKKKTDNFPRKSSFLKNLNLLPLLAEGWFKLPKGKKRTPKSEAKEDRDDIYFNKVEMDHVLGSSSFIETNYKEGSFQNCFLDLKIHKDDLADGLFPISIEHDPLAADDLNHITSNQTNPADETAFNEPKEGTSLNDSTRETPKKPLKGILKCPSSNNLLLSSTTPSMPASPPSTSKDPMIGRAMLKRANSKGCNVSFTHHLSS